MMTIILQHVKPDTCWHRHSDSGNILLPCRLVCGCVCVLQWWAGFLHQVAAGCNHCNLSDWKDSSSRGPLLSPCDLSRLVLARLSSALLLHLVISITMLQISLPWFSWPLHLEVAVSSLQTTVTGPNITWNVGESQVVPPAAATMSTWKWTLASMSSSIPSSLIGPQSENTSLVFAGFCFSPFLECVWNKLMSGFLKSQSGDVTVEPLWHSWPT